MKSFLGVVGIFAFGVSVYGVLLPALISYPDTFLVVLGAFIGVVVAPSVIFYALKAITK